MLSDTLQHAELNAALQPYYSEMCFDTFAASPWRWGKGGGGGSGAGQGQEEEEGWRETRSLLV